MDELLKYHQLLDTGHPGLSCFSEGIIRRLIEVVHPLVGEAEQARSEARISKIYADSAMDMSKAIIRRLRYG